MPAQLMRTSVSYMGYTFSIAEHFQLRGIF